MSTVKKIASLSTKSFGYSAKEVRKIVEASPGEKIFLARIGGVAKEFFVGESKHGEYVGFKGLFFAINKDGEKFSSEVAFFPKNLSDKLREGFSEGVLQIDVPAADIFAVETEKNASGYAYMCNFAMDDDAIKKADAIAAVVFGGTLPTQLKLAAPVQKTVARK